MLSFGKRPRIKPTQEVTRLLLKRNNELIKKVRISLGGVSGTVVDSKIIFKHALDVLASAMILVHNHPSGNLKPSQQDERITRQLVEAGRFFLCTVQEDRLCKDSDGG